LVGYPDEVVLRYLTEHPADLLLMGAFHDRGASSATAIGPTVQRLVQHAPSSIWVVKGHHPVFRRMLACVALDDTVVVDVAARLAHALGAELTVLHVVTPVEMPALAGVEPGEAQEMALSVDQALSQGAPLSVAVQGWLGQLEMHGVPRDALVLERGPAPDSILRMARDGGYDLVVVGSQSGPGYFLGSVANSAVLYAPQSVLVVRTRAH
jgi:nucleotide-binding universal stress UspA family protein